MRAPRSLHETSGYAHTDDAGSQAEKRDGQSQADAILIALGAREIIQWPWASGAPLRCPSLVVGGPAGGGGGRRGGGAEVGQNKTRRVACGAFSGAFHGPFSWPEL